MDAPLYPPATTFIQPQRQARILNTRDTSIADLKANPTAWAIVLKEMPNVEQRIGAGPLVPHLGNFSFESLLPFGVVKRDQLTSIDAQLRAMGASK